MIPFPRSCGLLLVAALLLGPPGLAAREEVPPDLTASEHALPEIDFESVEPALEPRLRAGLAGIEAMLAEEPLPSEELAAAYGTLGQMLVAVGQFGPARTAFREAAEVSPDDRWHHLLGLAAQADGDLDAAVSAYRAALRLNPDYVPARIRAGETLLERGFLDAAAKAFQEALDASPDDPGALRGAGRVALERGEPARAITLLEQALELSPFADSLHGLLARAHAAAGDEGKALYHRARAGEAEMIPVDPLALEISRLSQVLTLEVARRRAEAADFSERNFLVWIRTRLAPIPSAPDGLDRLVASMGDDSSQAVRGRLLWAKAEILATRGQWDEVGDAAEAALALDPELASARYLRAEALRRDGEIPRARAELQQVLDRDPAHRRARESRIALRTAAGDLEGALEESRALREHYPDDVDTGLRIAELLEGFGRQDEALGFLEELVRLSESGSPRARALVALAAAQTRRGDFAAAEESYLGARSEQPELTAAILGEAGLLARRGELEAAAEAYRGAIELEPLNERARQLEASALILAERHGEAVARLEEAVAVLPRSLPLRALLARHLAASPDPETRDGERAVELARAVQEEQPGPVAMETLAMALAEAGRFEEAVEWQERLVRESGDPASRARLEANLERYRRDLSCCAS